MRALVFGQYVVSAFRLRVKLRRTAVALAKAVRRTAIVVAFVVASAVPAGAQERFRISGNIAQQASTSTVTQKQTFDRYFEQGSFTFDRTIPKAPVYDVGALVRLWSGLHAGAALSVFDKTGTGRLSARVPHPLQFNKPRTVTGDIANATRREVGQHFMFGWNISTTPTGPRRPRASRGLDFTLFAGPSIFSTDELFVTSLMLTLDKEVFPFDELAFPAAQAQTIRNNVLGYNAGVDMTWRFTNKIGVGLLLRYSHGKKEFTPTGVQPVEVTVGGLHAGGGLRVLFGSFGSGRKPQPPPPTKQPPKQPPKGK